MTLARMLAAAAARQPEATAIVDGERRQSYGAWQTEIQALAGGLGAMGLGPGDHLVAVLANRSETASLYWACQMLGVIFTPFNWRGSAADMAYVLADADAKAVVYEQRSAAAMVAAVAEVGFPAEMLVDLDGAGPGIAFADLKKDQQKQVESVMRTLLEPFRKEDADEVMQVIKANGGMEQLHLAFYGDGRNRDEARWHFWRLEGPGFIWNYRVLPHVHCYVNIVSRA